MEILWCGVLILSFCMFRVKQVMQVLYTIQISC